MIYLLKCGRYLKVGHTEGQTINHRLHQIRNATPYDIEVLATRPGERWQEEDFHDFHRQQPWHHRGDWYVDCPELRSYCEQFFFTDSGDPIKVPSSDGGADPQKVSPE